MSRQRQPERLLDVNELRALLGEHRNTIARRFHAGGEWHADAFLIGNEYKLPVSAYNRWLETKRVALVGEEA